MIANNYIPQGFCSLFSSPHQSCLYFHNRRCNLISDQNCTPLLFETRVDFSMLPFPSKQSPKLVNMGEQCIPFETPITLLSAHQNQSSVELFTLSLDCFDVFENSRTINKQQQRYDRKNACTKRPPFAIKRVSIAL